MTDFTAHEHPVLAVACLTCGARASTWCHGPSGHVAPELYEARWIEADRLFMEQHGELADHPCRLRPADRPARPRPRLRLIMQPSWT